MKSFGPINSNFMHGLKSAILAIFQKLADWQDWALQNGSHDFFFSFLYLNPEKKILCAEMEGCTNRAWPIQPISQFLKNCQNGTF